MNQNLWFIASPLVHSVYIYFIRQGPPLIAPLRSFGLFSVIIGVGLLLGNASISGSIPLWPLPSGINSGIFATLCSSSRFPMTNFVSLLPLSFPMSIFLFQHFHLAYLSRLINRHLLWISVQSISLSNARQLSSSGGPFLCSTCAVTVTGVSPNLASIVVPLWSDKKLPNTLLTACLLPVPIACWWRRLRSVWLIYLAYQWHNTSVEYFSTNEHCSDDCIWRGDHQASCAFLLPFNALPSLLGSIQLISGVQLQMSCLSMLPYGRMGQLEARSRQNELRHLLPPIILRVHVYVCIGSTDVSLCALHWRPVVASNTAYLAGWQL